MYRYIGKGVTDNNGVAHLTENADGETVEGYVGTGKGLTQFVASTDKPADISDSSLLSETYEIWDTLFFDNCTDNSKASKYHRYNNTVSEPSFDETGMFVERTSTGNGYLFIGVSNSSDTPFPLDFAVEFDVVEITGDVRFATGGTFDTIRNMSANDHYKVEYYTDKQVITKNDGTPITNAKTNSGSFKCQLQFVGVTSIKLKNIRVYSI